MSENDVAVLILAAGFSRRLGQPKSCVRLPSGLTLLDHAVKIARDAGLAAWVAVPVTGEATEEAKRLGVPVVTVADAGEGMSASIRAGVMAISATPVDGVLITLVDQWRLTGDDFRRLTDAWRCGGRRVTAARYADAIGVPAIFSRRYFPMLETLEGDRGARTFLRSGDSLITSIDLPTAAADLDTPADVVALDGR